jgi:1-hydroxycarotenoid 3,4-desaturase
MVPSKSMTSIKPPKRSETIAVIGAGVGGLACAIDLAAAGRAVTVFERGPRAGGRLREIALEGGAVDSGPTVFTLRRVFDELFESAGDRLDGHLVLSRLDRLARHAWADGSELDLYSDIDQSAAAIGALSGAGAARGYRAFCAESRRIFETLEHSYLRRPQTTAVGLAARLGPARIGDLLAIRPYETLWNAVGRHFDDPRLRQLFGRYATYCGSSPFAAPATLMLVAHVEREGVWVVEGGMQRLVEALEGLALRLGVTFRYNTEIAAIGVSRGRADGVTTADGTRIAAAEVVINGDIQALARGAFGAAAAPAVTARPPSDRSLSALTWSATAWTHGFALGRHNVFFSHDYRGEFDDILVRDRLPAAPTVYVCAQDREAGAAPSEGPERLLLLVNAPANGDRRNLGPEEIAACEKAMFDHLERCGLSVSPSGSMQTTTPTDFQGAFPGSGGALYGSATHGWSGAFRRPGSRTRLPGLYLAGGGVHPGAGLPMVALSGRLAASSVMADQDSTRRWGRGATFGGISTRSATMDDQA